MGDPQPHKLKQTEPLFTFEHTHNVFDGAIFGLLLQQHALLAQTKVSRTTTTTGPAPTHATNTPTPTTATAASTPTPRTLIVLSIEDTSNSNTAANSNEDDTGAGRFWSLRMRRQRVPVVAEDQVGDANAAASLCVQSFVKIMTAHHIASPGLGPQTTTTTDTCNVCLEDVPISRMFQPHCKCVTTAATSERKRHLCIPCAQGLVSTAVQRHTKTEVLCPICSQEWSLEDIRNLSSPDQFRKFLDRRLRKDILAISESITCPVRTCQTTFLPRNSMLLMESAAMPLASLPTLETVSPPQTKTATTSDIGSSTSNVGEEHASVLADSHVDSLQPPPPAQWGVPPLRCVCPHCSHDFCTMCRMFWHGGMSCDGIPQRNHVQDELETQQWKRRNTKPCPRCRSPIFAEGMDRVKCYACDHTFCYKCGASWTGTHQNKYRLNGCTGKNWANMWDTRLYTIERWLKLALRVIILGVGCILGLCVGVVVGPFLLCVPLIRCMARRGWFDRLRARLRRRR